MLKYFSKSGKGINISNFYRTIFYVDPDTLIVRLIDFNTGQINAGYEFPASQKHNA